MVTVKYDRKNWSMSVRGHAGCGAPGTDTVCAGASALIYAAAGALCKEKHRFHPEIAHGSGLIAIRCAPRNKAKERCRTILDTVWVGFEELAHEYAENVRLERTEHEED